MKKYIVTIVSILLFSCSTEDVQKTEDFLSKDAEGTYIAWESMGEYAYLEPGYSLEYAATVGALYSIFGGAGAPIPVDYELPNQYVVQENPYEIVGIIHNDVLNYLQTTPDGIEKALALDPEVVALVENSYSNNSSARLNSGSKQSFLLSDQAKQMINKLNIPGDKDKSAIQVLQERANNTNAAVTNYAIMTIRRFQSLYSGNNGSLIEKLNFLNNEIRAVLNSQEDKHTKDPKLVFLTVYKHSCYYWR
jgi:hypothetical protein